MARGRRRGFLVPQKHRMTYADDDPHPDIGTSLNFDATLPDFYNSLL